MGGPKRVSLLALPQESMGAPIHGMYETLALADTVAGAEAKLFEVEIVGPEVGVFPTATGLPVEVHRAFQDVERTDIVISASMLVENEGWVLGRHDEAVAWLREMHAGGAILASACAGALLLAETGLLDGMETTTHWAFAPAFRRAFPNVRLRLEDLLIVGGPRQELIMSGAASSWQELLLYVISREAGPRVAQAIGKFFLYEWSLRSQSPFLPFVPPTDHGDATIEELQAWLETKPTASNPVEEMARRTNLPVSTFNRRFKRATGMAPLQYTQRLRIEEAKRLLETTEQTVEQICVAAGYEEPAAFRRIFKRVTSLTPSEYRRKFRVPEPLPA